MSSSIDSLDRDIERLSRRTENGLSLKASKSKSRSRQDRFTSPYRGNARNISCDSCSLTLPENVRTRLPMGSPGSPKSSSTERSTGTPILRSREFIHACGPDQHPFPEESEDECKNLHSHRQSHYRSPPSSTTSSLSDASFSSTASGCHSHTLEFVTTSSPVSPDSYTRMRQASIRTLSGEQLPNGITSGPLFFGDAASGFVIAYKFRLADPFARGQERSYTFIALSGHSQAKAFEATSIIWRTFEKLAGKMISKAEATRKRERQAGNTTEPAAAHSFISQRNHDPDGYPRAGGTRSVVTKARGLAEILGDDYIFADLHRGFVGLLQSLGKHYGGSHT